ncbi:unnamed protein product, partial [Rotaria sp. Silwood2]
IITSIKTKLQERIDSEFFGAACRYKLMRLPIDTQNRLKSSFIKFLSAIIAYIDSYFDKNITFYQTISYFGQENIEGLTWHQVIQCVEIIKLKSLDEDRLFDEFTNVKSVFKTLLDQPVSLFDQVQAFIRKQNDISKINNCVDEKEDDDDDHLTTNKVVKSDQLWMFLFSITQSPNFKKLICFLYSLPCSNAFVESVFSQMKHLLNDRRKPIDEKIRLESNLFICPRCTDSDERRNRLGQSFTEEITQSQWEIETVVQSSQFENQRCYDQQSPLSSEQNDAILSDSLWPVGIESWHIHEIKPQRECFTRKTLSVKFQNQRQIETVVQPSQFEDERSYHQQSSLSSEQNDAILSDSLWPVGIESWHIHEIKPQRECFTCKMLPVKLMITQFTDSESQPKHPEDHCGLQTHILSDELVYPIGYFDGQQS